MLLHGLIKWNGVFGQVNIFSLILFIVFVELAIGYKFKDLPMVSVN